MEFLNLKSTKIESRSSLLSALKISILDKSKYKSPSKFEVPYFIINSFKLKESLLKDTREEKCFKLNPNSFLKAIEPISRSIWSSIILMFDKFKSKSRSLKLFPNEL